MAAQRRKFQRPLGARRYKKLFLVAAEGIKTEPIYFSVFTDDKYIVNPQLPGDLAPNYLGPKPLEIRLAGKIRELKGCYSY